MLLSHDDLAHAQAIVYAHMLPTPAYRWPLLCSALGCDVWVKHENHTPIGAFKARGGLVYLDYLGKKKERGDLVTATRGNHGQAIPFAARQYRRTVHVYVPENNSVEKNAAMQAWGAILHVHGRDFDQAREEAEAHAEREDAVFVPNYSEHLVRGVATYSAELFGAVADLDAVYVPIGMGSGAISVIAVRDLLGLNTEVVGVVTEAADAVALSLEAGRVVTTDSASTFADGLATRVPLPEVLAVLQKGLARIVRVSDDAVAEAVRLLYRTTHNVAEGAGAAATAAATQERDLNAGKRIAVILTGGNVDAAVFKQVLDGVTPSVGG